MSFVDRTLTCRDCQEPFIFTAGEQEFHASKGFDNDPSRCPSCRAARKRARGDGGGRPPRQGGGGPGGHGGGGRREMHSAICAECGQEALVPFVPSGSRPVYCRDCFSKQGGGGGRRGGGGGGGGRGFGGGGGGRHRGGGGGGRGGPGRDRW